MAKGPDAFRTISEAAAEVGVAQHVLRFWESRFPFLRPMKRAGGRRFYRPADIAMLQTIRRLLHEEGRTIKAVQKLHRDRSLESSSPARRPPPGEAQPDSRQRDIERLTESLVVLEAVKHRLDTLLAGR